MNYSLCLHARERKIPCVTRVGMTTLIVVLSFVLFACTNDFSENDEDTGAISINLQFYVEADAPQDLVSPVDCTALGLSEIRCNVYEGAQSQANYLTGTTWPCAAYTGVIENVLAGENRLVVVMGSDSAGNDLYSGSASGIIVTAGQTTDAGAIDMSWTRNTAPVAEILSPDDNSTFTSGEIVSFVATGEDAEDGSLATSAFVWTSSLDGQIKSGAKSFSTDNLTIGTHIITLIVTDSDNASEVVTCKIIIYSAAPITNSLGMSFIYIPPGTFMMGSPEDEFIRYRNEIQHHVTLTKGYYLQTTEVTQGQWKAVMGSTQSWFSSCGDDCPVENTSWVDAQEFIETINTLDEGIYRLPTEAEWEYACRAGSDTAFANGGISEADCKNDPNLSVMAWYCYNSDNTTHPVAQKHPNVWGLYDMHGNVCELCSDWYAAYPTVSVIDPAGPSSGDSRVKRGGSWYAYAQESRSACRSHKAPDSRRTNIGFRLAKTP